MKKALITVSCLLFSSAFALAQDTPTPPTKPGADAPTKAMDSATPTMKSPSDPTKAVTGTSSSDCSNPLVARIAIRLPETHGWLRCYFW